MEHKKIISKDKDFGGGSDEKRGEGSDKKLLRHAFLDFLPSIILCIAIS